MTAFVGDDRHGFSVNKSECQSSGTEDLLDTLEQNVSVLLLEDQHRSQSDGLSTTATDVDT